MLESAAHFSVNNTASNPLGLIFNQQRMTSWPTDETCESHSESPRDSSGHAKGVHHMLSKAQGPEGAATAALGFGIQVICGVLSGFWTVKKMAKKWFTMASPMIIFNGSRWLIDALDRRVATRRLIHQ